MRSCGQNSMSMKPETRVDHLRRIFLGNAETAWDINRRESLAGQTEIYSPTGKKKKKKGKKNKKTTTKKQTNKKKTTTKNKKQNKKNKKNKKKNNNKNKTRNLKFTYDPRISL